MDQANARPLASDASDVAARVRAIQSRLPGQMLRERLEMAAILYGPLYSLAEVRERVGATLPRRVGFVRGAVLEPIETHRGPIPAEVLLKYDDALQSGLFSKVLIATPTYYSERQVDPWVVAEVVGSDQWAVIAQWDDTR